MALLFMDSFDHYATAQLPTKWDVVPPSGFAGGGSPVTIGAYGRRSTSGVRTQGYPNTQNAGYIKKTLTPIGTTFIWGASVRWTGVNNAFYTGGDSPMICYLARLGSRQNHLRLNTASGLLEFTRANAVIATSSSGLAVGTHTFIEYKVDVAPGTAGSVEVRINGTPVLGPLTGMNTAEQGVAGWDQFLCGYIGSGAGSSGVTMQFDFDDMYVLDGSGGAPWNNFLGDCRVEPKYVTAEGSLIQWAPFTGTDNSAMVDEVTPDDDSSYVSSVTPGDTDTYVVEDTTPGAGPTALQLVAYAKKSAEGLAPTFGVIRVGSPPVDYTYPMDNLSTTYGMRTVQIMTNPATGLPWTEAEFNAAEFGLNRG